MKASMMAFRIVALLAALAAPASGWAWMKSVCSGNGEELDWDNETTQIRFSSVSFPVGAFRNSLDDSIDRWDEDPSDFDFTKSFGDTSIDFSNDQSEAWFTSDNDYDPAMAVVRYKGLAFCGNPRIVEADLLFYTGEDYTTSMDTAALWEYDTNENGNSDRPFQTTAVHELGHALGLEHENDEYNVMGQDWTHIHVNATEARAYPGEDASDGAIDLYGSVAVEDVGVAHWIKDGVDGEYSLHSHSELLTAGGAPLSSDPYGEWRVYYADPGDTIQVQLVYENNGLSDQDVDVGIYLSTNNLITTYDDRLGGFGTTLSRGNVSQVEETVTIPSDQPPGDYWIGAVIDEDDVVTDEITETNNATWIRLTIR